MNQITKYEAAKHALAEARSIDEVKDIRDKAMAMRIYARQAKDKSLEQDATEIRLRAERRLGEMMAEMPKAPGGQPYQSTGVFETPVGTLASVGIDKNLAKRARTLAKMPEKEFEKHVVDARYERVIEPKKEKPPGYNMTDGVCNSLRYVAHELHRYDDLQLSNLRDACHALIRRIDEQLQKGSNVTCLSSRR